MRRGFSTGITSLNHAMQSKNVNKKPSCCWGSRSYFSHVKTSLIYDIKIKGLESGQLYIAAYRPEKPEQQLIATRSSVLTGNDTGGAAQVAAAHGPNERTLDPAVCR